MAYPCGYAATFEPTFQTLETYTAVQQPYTNARARGDPGDCMTHP